MTIEEEVESCRKEASHEGWSHVGGGIGVVFMEEGWNVNLTFTEEVGTEIVDGKSLA